MNNSNNDVKSSIDKDLSLSEPIILRKRKTTKLKNVSDIDTSDPIIAKILEDTTEKFLKDVMPFVLNIIECRKKLDMFAENIEN